MSRTGSRLPNLVDLLRIRQTKALSTTRRCIWRTTSRASKELRAHQGWERAQEEDWSIKCRCMEVRHQLATAVVSRVQLKSSSCYLSSLARSWIRIERKYLRWAGSINRDWWRREVSGINSLRKTSLRLGRSRRSAFKTCQAVTMLRSQLYLVKGAACQESHLKLSNSVILNRRALVKRLVDSRSPVPKRDNPLLRELEQHSQWQEQRVFKVTEGQSCHKVLS